MPDLTPKRDLQHLHLPEAEPTAAIRQPVLNPAWTHASQVPIGPGHHLHEMTEQGYPGAIVTSTPDEILAARALID